MRIVHFVLVNVLVSVLVCGHVCAAVTVDSQELLKAYVVHVDVNIGDDVDVKKYERVSATGTGTGIDEGRCYITTIANIFPKDYQVRDFDITLIDARGRVSVGRLDKISFAADLALVSLEDCYGTSRLFRTIGKSEHLRPIVLAYDGFEDRIEVSRPAFVGRMPHQFGFLLTDDFFIFGKEGSPVYDGEEGLLGMVSGRSFSLRIIPTEHGIEEVLRPLKYINVIDSEIIIQFFLSHLNKVMPF